MTTRQNASLSVQGKFDLKPKASPYWGGESSAFRPKFFTRQYPARRHPDALARHASTIGDGARRPG
ncbi:hypothetical protein ACFOEY_18165 [Paracandidimonas soli]|uniref:hypothetical protein n=1 Tax=Paracandidimonas soli TaxID=1917182 RepID=UPI003609F618